MSFSKKVQNIFIIIFLYLISVFFHIFGLIKQLSLSDQSYFLFRIIETISTDGVFAFFQSLTQSTNTVIENPLLLAIISPLWSFAGSINMFLTIIVLLMGTSSVFLYLFLQRYEHKRYICFIAGIIGGVNPLVFALYAKGLVISALLFPTTLFFFFLFFSYRGNITLRKKIIIIFFLSLITIFTSHIVFALSVILVLLTSHYIEKKESISSQRELFMYLLLLYFFAQYVIYHTLFSQSGIKTLFFVTSAQAFNYAYFFDIFSQIVLPFLLIGLGAYYRSFRIRTNQNVLFSFCFFSVGLLLFLLKVQYAHLLLIYVFTALVLTFPYMSRFLSTYWKSSKFAGKTGLLQSAFLLFFLLFILAFFLPLLFEPNHQLLTESESETYVWISENLPANAFFFRDPQFANKLMLYTGSETFVTENDYDTPYGQKKIMIQETLFKTPFESFALSLIRENKQSGKTHYLYWDKTKNGETQKPPSYLDGNCFEEIYQNTNELIYAIRCLEEKNE